MSGISGNDPPSRPILIRHPTKNPDSRQDSELDVPSKDSHHSEAAHDIPKVDLLQAASIVKQAGPKLDLASNAPEVSQTLPRESALAPWLNALNPSHPRKDGADFTAQFGRWQHVFPHAVRASTVKWKSLCSPAAVPLTTDCFPTGAQLASEYHENPYAVSQDDEEDSIEASKSRDEFFKELIGMRLAQGYQFVVGDAVAETLHRPLLATINIFDEEFLNDESAMVVMSLGNTIHQMQRVGNGEVELKRQVRKPISITGTGFGKDDSSSSYDMYIRTSLAEGYESRQINLRPRREEYSWNYVDSFLAGQTESYTEQLRFWRARFVLIPMEQPPAARNSSQVMTEDNEEEIRIEGIRKFTQMLQRCRHRTFDDRRFQDRLRDKPDANPLDVSYQTRDPSAVVAAELDNLPLLELDSTHRSGSLLDKRERFQRTNLNLSSLGQEIQSEKGVPMQDRRWHWRLHYNCFIGSEMTTWLLDNFSDVDTREEAVELGRELMTAGLFQHVEKRHQFRDGNFFYQLGVDFRNNRAESRRGWFGTRKADKSVPSTPASDVSRDSPQAERARPGPKPDSILVEAGETTSTGGGGKKLRVALSKMMRYDVDHRKRSYRPEIINLHYDRLHHPDNCYHLRIDWMNVTAKLIEDAIVTWATSVEKHGLRLVEVPIREVSSITESHPLRSPYLVKIAQPPPPSQAQFIFDAESLGPRAKADSLFYHKAIIKRFGFVLDIEAATNFPPDVEVTYSWGKPDYRYTQYIHRSGLLLAQITDTGEFLLLANRLYNNRSAGGGGTSGGERYESRTSEARDRRSGGHYLISPFASPLVRATNHESSCSTAITAATVSSTTHLDSICSHATTAEELKDRFELFCADARALQYFYDEILAKAPTSPPMNLTTPVLEASIPSLGLPPPTLATRHTDDKTTASSPSVHDSQPSLADVRDLSRSASENANTSESGPS